MEIRGWDNESCRSVANVSWVSGSTNVYRLGHKGNVDLRYLQAASGGYYYRDHMPILGTLLGCKKGTVAYIYISKRICWFSYFRTKRGTTANHAVNQGHLFRW